MSDKLKEFELTRTTTIRERRFVMATDLEEAETMVHDYVDTYSKEVIEWDCLDERQEVDVEEV